jgi:hypothetical protein
MTHYWEENIDQIEGKIYELEEKGESARVKKIETQLNQLCDHMRIGHCFPYHIIQLSRIFCFLIDNQKFCTYHNVANYYFLLGIKLLTNIPTIGFKDDLFGDDNFLNEITHHYPIPMKTPLDQRKFLSYCSLAKTFYQNRYYDEIVGYLLNSDHNLNPNWYAESPLNDSKFCQKHLGMDSFFAFQRHLSDLLHENLLRLMERTTDHNSLIQVYLQFVLNLNFSKANPELALICREYF